ncbi:hypothetical protein EB796_020767 [Bugula neritina]|uniref:Uncharacterized protein n=1 Tax=Bugula neritina TaxID=10212 RepID=A0A7J7J5H1_BUGNE|nr:hypothetical protein EB796_020767 [Bugula neritina]
MQPTPLKDCRSFQESNKFHVMPESPQYQVDTKPKNYAPKSVDTEEKGSLVGKSPEESEPVLVDATDTDSTFISQAKDVPSNFSEGSTARDKGCTKFDIDEFKGTESCDVNEIARQLLDSANKINQAKAAVKESDDNLRMATSSDEQPLITSAEITSPTSISHGPHKSLKQKSLVLEVKDGRLSQLDSVYKLGGSANSSEKIDSLKNFGGIFPESSSNSPNSSVSTSKKLLAVENRFQDREEMEKGISVNTPLITSTTQMSRSTKRSSGSFGEASKSKSVLGRLGPQRKSNRGRNGKDDGQDFGRSEPNKDSESHRFGRSKSPRHRSRSSKSANMPSRRISRHASPGASVNKMFSDPFLAFVHETLTGIILIGQYRKALAKSTEPETLLSKIDQEQINMRNRMLTDNGHLIIQMARCCIENPQDLERAFPNVNKDIGPILRNLDRDVITLIADTPIVVNT